jgi:hypothetical protein
MFMRNTASCLKLELKNFFGGFSAFIFNFENEYNNSVADGSNPSTLEQVEAGPSKKRKV